MTNFARAHLLEITKYSKPWQDEWLLLNDGVIQRAGSQGDGHTVAGSLDNKWDEYHPNVMRFTIRGSYWYFGSRVSWKQQADIFLQIVKNDFHFLICDFETFGNTMSAAFVASAMEFCLYLRSKGYKVIIYTNLSIYNEWLGLYDRARAAQFDLHISWPIDTLPAIIAQVDTYKPATPRARQDWLIWQWAFGEHNPTGCEMDVFNGSPAEMLQWATQGCIPPTPPDPPTGEGMYTGQVITSKLNVRIAMDSNSTDVGDVLLNAALTGDQIVNQNGFDWLRIVTPTIYAGKFVACGPTSAPRSFIKVTGAPEPPKPAEFFAKYRVTNIITVYQDKTTKVESTSVEQID